jgi:hypothetical protein
MTNMVGPASVNWRGNGLRLRAFILGVRRRRCIGMPAPATGAVSHSEVGNVWHFADRSIASFNLGGDQCAATPQDAIAITVRVGLGLATFASLRDIPLTPCQTDSQLKKDYLYQTLTHWPRS